MVKLHGIGILASTVWMDNGMTWQVLGIDVKLPMAKEMDMIAIWMNKGEDPCSPWYDYKLHHWNGSLTGTLYAGISGS